MDKRILVGVAIILVVAGIIVFAPKQSNDTPVEIAGFMREINDFASSTQYATTTDGTNAQIILNRNANRTYAAIVNDSDTDVYLFLRNFDNLGAASTTVRRNNGIRVNAGGGSYEILPENLYIGDIWVSSTTVAGKRILVTEGR